MSENLVEEWRPVPGLEGVEASSLGGIRENGIVRIPKPKVRDYLGVRVHKKSFLAHRLVCMAFYGLPTEEEPECLHLDNNPTNNRADNLKWGSHDENMARSRGRNHSHPGESNFNSKLTEADVREIRAAYDAKAGFAWGISKLAKKFNISTKTCSRIGKRESWQHLD